MASTQPDGTRKLILETAKNLLRRHGEDKMTVVDIARSLGMSHANVYRFFKNKSEILDAITDEWLRKVESFVDAIAARTAPAADRIEAVVLELHRKRRRKLIEDAAFFETYRRVAELRPEVIARRREKIWNVFQRLIQEGIDSGEFRAVDAAEVATVLKDATALFLHPLMIPTAINEDSTGERVSNVVRYILAGFLGKGTKLPVRSATRRAGTKAKPPAGAT
ncbi:MAG TPA: TetR family transcriptional regulator [Verrucomicrobiae bacterium]|nr:TetR family transcriptional regulator [Verrucomicrobiae bacterium]